MAIKKGIYAASMSIFNQDLTFSDYCINNGLNNFMPKLHPTKEQHKLWSEYLYEKIRVLE